MKKPDGPKPVKARAAPTRKVTTATPQLASQPKASALALTNGEKDVSSPRLLPLPNGAFAGFMASAAATSTDDGAGRFCTEGPRLEFGGPIAEASAGDVPPVPLRQFASRLQSSIASSAMLVLDRLQALKRQAASFNAVQLEQLLQISHGVQAAAYYMQKWAAGLQKEAALPVKPGGLATSGEEALALMNITLPKMIVSSSELQSMLKDLVPKVKLPQKPGPMTD